MALDLCSEISAMGMSPRISFSQDFCQTDGVPIEHHNLLSDTTLDFDFCVRQSFDRDSSSADELFSDGKIKMLPIQIKQKDPITKSKLRTDEPKPAQNRENGNRERENPKSEAEEKHSSKSFWRFKRSSSLNCGSGGYGRGLCPLPLLSRSNSTGSEPSIKRNQNQTQKQSALKPSQPQPKPPLKKSYVSQYSSQSMNGGVRINPVLNVASPAIFGFGSFFIGKDKSKRR